MTESIESLKAELAAEKTKTAAAQAEAVKAKAEAVKAKAEAVEESEINQKANLLLIRDHGLNLVLPPTQTTVAGKSFHLQYNEHILVKLKSLFAPSKYYSFQLLNRQ